MVETVVANTEMRSFKWENLHVSLSVAVIKTTEEYGGHHWTVFKILKQLTISILLVRFDNSVFGILGPAIKFMLKQNPVFSAQSTKMPLRTRRHISA